MKSLILGCAVQTCISMDFCFKLCCPQNTEEKKTSRRAAINDVLDEIYK